VAAVDRSVEDHSAEDHSVVDHSVVDPKVVDPKVVGQTAAGPTAAGPTAVEAVADRSEEDRWAERAEAPMHPIPQCAVHPQNCRHHTARTPRGTNPPSPASKASRPKSENCPDQ
jgi:hypothetical protein